MLVETSPFKLKQPAILVRVADQIVQALYEAGVRVVFGVPGGAISGVYDALLDEPRIRVINAHHECSAVHAAAAYARTTGTVGVVLTTSGPGVTNAITGMASAFCDSLPVLLISGEVPRKNFGRGALQEGSAYCLNLISMLRPITKLATEVTAAEAAVATVRKGLATAGSGRKGPVFISLPLDVQGCSTTVPRMAVNVQSRFEVDRGMLNAAVEKLITAERPLILAGSGCRWGQGPAALRRLAEQLQIPVATTPKAKGVFPESHPLALGIFGYAGHPSTAAYLAEGIDVLFAVGTSFGDVATNNWSSVIRPSGAFVQVDIDSTQIGKNYSADVGIVGPAAEVLSAMAELAPPQAVPRPGLGRTFFKPPSEIGEGTGGLRPQRALWELQQILPKSAMYSCDIGEHLLFTLHYLSIEAPDAFYVSSGLSSMGSSLGAATGMKLAMPDRPVVAVCGDGTMQMAALELGTAAQAGLNVIYLVLNDHRYGMVEEGHRSIYGRTPAFDIGLDLVKLAEGLGARAFRIERPGQILQLGAKELLGHAGPVLLDVQIDRAEKMPRAARFEALKNFVGEAPIARA